MTPGMGNSSLVYGPAALLKSCMENRQLDNSVVVAVSKSGRILPLNECEDAMVGELCDVPEPDDFPLQVKRKVETLRPEPAPSAQAPRLQGAGC